MSSDSRYATERPGIDRRTASVFTDVDKTRVSMQEIVGRKWHPPIVYHLLADGPLGFSSLKGRVDGVSSKMLSESLDALEAAGVVERSIVSDSPVRVEYALTERGESLEPLIGEMVSWGAAHESDDGSDSADSHVKSPAEAE